MELNMLEVVELGDRWSLSSQDAEVTRLCFDWGLVLTVGSVQPQTDIRIEQPAILVDQHGASIELLPDGDPVALAPMLQLLRRRLSKLEAFKDGHLRIEVAGGVALTVYPSEDFESWEITGPADFRMVCTPGGALTVWSRAAQE